MSPFAFKICSIVLQILLLATGVGAAAQSVVELLEQGTHEEHTVGDLDAAVEIYDRIINDAQADRPYVARALFRRGQCLLKSGKEELAIRSFEKLTAEYPVKQRGHSALPERKRNVPFCVAM